MPKGWSEMRLKLGEHIAEIRSRHLTPEQQGRLALAWPEMFLTGDLSEEGWRRALGYTDEEWSGDIYGAFSEVLGGSEHEYGYALPFMRREWARQQEFSEQQARRGRMRDPAKGSGGQPALASAELAQPPLATASHRLASPAKPSHAVASAVTVEAENLEPKPSETAENGDGHLAAQPTPRTDHKLDGFMEFWLAYDYSPRRLDRPACQAEWRRSSLYRITPDIMKALEIFKASREWKERIIPRSLKWLKDRSWENLSLNGGATDHRADPW